MLVLSVTQTARAVLCTICLLAAQSALADDLVVVVSANSPLQALTKNQVRNIFLGKTTMLPDGETVIPVDQPESSPLRETFYRQVTGRSAAEAKAYWAQLSFTGRGESPREALNSNDVKKILASTPGAIGYIEKSVLDASVKVLLIVE